MILILLIVLGELLATRFFFILVVLENGLVYRLLVVGDLVKG